VSSSDSVDINGRSSRVRCPVQTLSPPSCFCSKLGSLLACMQDDSRLCQTEKRRLRQNPDFQPAGCCMVISFVLVGASFLPSFLASPPSSSRSWPAGPPATTLSKLRLACLLACSLARLLLSLGCGGRRGGRRKYVHSFVRSFFAATVDRSMGQVQGGDRSG